MGTVNVTSDQGARAPLQPGMVLQAGWTIRTEVGAAADLDFGAAGIVRLTENTRVTLEQVPSPGSEQPGGIRLTLAEGTLLGMGSALGVDAKYEVKTPQGLLAVGARHFRVSAQGYLVLIEGTLVFVHVQADSKLTPHVLKAPPAVYFSPLEGVRPAPQALVREVTNQARAKLKGTGASKQAFRESDFPGTPESTSAPSEPPRRRF
jgi:hypothetical protein